MTGNGGVTTATLTSTLSADSKDGIHAPLVLLPAKKSLASTEQKAGGVSEPILTVCRTERFQLLPEDRSESPVDRPSLTGSLATVLMKYTSFGLGEGTRIK
jgi:hypothetical protein